jgi:hypothetical protein
MGRARSRRGSSRRASSPTAYLLYEVALALPMPDAQKGSPVLAGKRSVAARICSDFPGFFLAKVAG